MNVNNFSRDNVSGIIPEILEMSSNDWLDKIVKLKLLDKKYCRKWKKFSDFKGSWLRSK